MAVLFVGLTVWFVLMAIGQARELLFYRTNGWDFSVDNNISWMKFYNRRRSILEFGPARPEDLVSNRQRVCFGRPFFMLIVGILAAATAHINFHPEQWRREIHGSKVTYHYIGTPQPDAN